MKPGDLFFLFSAVVVLLALLGLLVALVAGRRALIRRLGLGLLVYVGMYMLLLLLTSVLSPEQVVAQGEPRCFDDWCLAVESVARASSIGSTSASGVYYLVTLEVSNRGRGRSQRAADAGVYVIDADNRRFAPSPAGERALAAAGLAGLPLSSPVEVGQPFTHTAVFDLPPDVRQPGLAVSHGDFPGVLIIGADHSLMHRPAVVWLDR